MRLAVAGLERIKDRTSRERGCASSFSRRRPLATWVRARDRFANVIQRARQIARHQVRGAYRRAPHRSAEQLPVHVPRSRPAPRSLGATACAFARSSLAIRGCQSSIFAPDRLGRAPPGPAPPACSSRPTREAPQKMPSRSSGASSSSQGTLSAMYTSSRQMPAACSFQARSPYPRGSTMAGVSDATIRGAPPARHRQEIERSSRRRARSDHTTRAGVCGSRAASRRAVKARAWPDRPAAPWA